MILVGIDDTDTPLTEGTNQLARGIARHLPGGCTAHVILRHQLFFDPRVPYTSQNGSASLLVDPPASTSPGEIAAVARAVLRERFVAGSDPGLCVASDSPLPSAVMDFARRCQADLVTAREALHLATRHQLTLEPLGGTGDGVIGALAAVALLASGDDGRVVELAGWPWPDPFAGPQTLEAIRARGVTDIRVEASGAAVTAGIIDIGKHLRPAWRHRHPVLFVRPTGLDRWEALKLP